MEKHFSLSVCRIADKIISLTRLFVVNSEYNELYHQRGSAYTHFVKDELRPLMPNTIDFDNDTESWEPLFMCLEAHVNLVEAQEIHGSTFTPVFCINPARMFSLYNKVGEWTPLFFTMINLETVFNTLERLKQPPLA